METCVRGFSYMPPDKVEIMDLQYIEGGELERTWKVSRRQRLKEQEQKIWDEFVKEQDIVRTALNDDPYQFLHQLPENCLKELMDSELKKMKKEQEPIAEQPNQGEGDHTEKQTVQMVTFAEDSDEAGCNMTFHIFDDDNDNMSDDEGRDSPGQSTVRERYSETQVTQRSECADTRERGSGSVKSSENVPNMVESSIYCARVKDLRIKINEEMLAIMASLEIQDVMSVERAEVTRRLRRSAEFSARFNRIYMYQLHRQTQDISRHLSAATPFAKHTQFQSHMLRVVSLHQNYLQALQVFHKSFPSTSCLRESTAQLHGAVRLLRDVSALCRAAPAPRDTPAAPDLYSDELLVTCDRVDAALNEYVLRVADYVKDNDTPDNKMPLANTRPRKHNNSPKSKRKGHLALGGNGRGKLGSSKTSTNKDVGSRLSMYSLTSGRAPRPPPPPGGTNNIGDTPSTSARKHVKSGRGKSPRTTSPRRRRPLMRAPGSVRTRRSARREPQRDDIDTLVQNVDTCPSSQVSPTRSTPRVPRLSRRRPARSPRLNNIPGSPRQSQSTSPRVKSRSPRRIGVISKVASNTKPQNKKHLISSATRTNIAPFTKIQAKKESDNNKVAEIHSAREQTQNTINISNCTLSPKDCYSGDSAPRNLLSAKDQRSARDQTRNTNSISYSALSPKDGYSGYLTPRNVRSAKDHVNKDVNSPKGLDFAIDSASITPRNDLCSKKHGNIGNPGKEEGTGKEFANKHAKEERYTGKECTVEVTETYADVCVRTPRKNDDRDSERSERKNRASNIGPAQCEVTRLIRQLCSGDAIGSRNERVSGVKNAQLLCITGGSPSRQPSTPQLLRILEETIQKQAPRPMFQKHKDPDRYRLNFNIPEETANKLFQYRTKFVQHMLTSPMYANSAVGKPWEMIGCVSDKIIEELMMNCAKEMQIRDVIQELYKLETN